MDVRWNGITRSETINEKLAKVCFALADAAKEYRWSRVFEILTEDSELVNFCRPDESSLCAPLHHAAHGGRSC